MNENENEKVAEGNTPPPRTYPHNTSVVLLFKTMAFIPAGDPRGGVKFAANVCPAQYLGFARRGGKLFHNLRLTGFDPPLANAWIDDDDILIIGEASKLAS